MVISFNLLSCKFTTMLAFCQIFKCTCFCRPRFLHCFPHTLEYLWPSCGFLLLWWIHTKSKEGLNASHSIKKALVVNLLDSNSQETISIMSGAIVSANSCCLVCRCDRYLGNVLLHQAVGLGAPQTIIRCHRGHYKALSRCRLVGSCVLAKISFRRPTTMFARLTQSQAISQSIAFSSPSDQWKIRTSFTFFYFFETLFYIERKR